MNSFVERTRRALVAGNKKVLGAMLSKESHTVVSMAVRTDDFTSLLGSTHCLLVTYKRDGTPVAHPVWPGYSHGRVYVWTEIEAFKAKRLRRNPDALIAPCSFRGKPLGPPIAARGRILDADAERAQAEATIRAQWGWTRRAFAAAAGQLTAVHYIEFVPAGRLPQPVSGAAT